MEERKIITLSRDTLAMMVPSGARVMLHKGTEVTLTQSLGGSFTVNVYGNLARIEAKDAESLGIPPEDPLRDLNPNVTPDERVNALLKTVYDPEIPVNIVDLGLIYSCTLSPAEQPGQYTVEITMTLTAPGCGMGPVIVEDVKQKLRALPEVDSVNVEMVFSPPWDRDRMSELAKLELGML